MYATRIAALLAAVGLALALPSNNDVLSARGTGGKCPVLKPAPAGSLCEKVGTLTKPNPTADFDDHYFPEQAAACSNAIQCREKCKAIDSGHCQSFSFDSATKVCSFYNSTISEQGFVPKASSTTTFNDAACSKCHGCLPNLLNGNWESGSISPWATDIYTNTEIVAGYNSSHAISISPDGTGTPGGFRYGGIYQYFDKCVGAVYNVDFDYMWPTAGDGNEALWVGMQLADDDASEVIWTMTTSSMAAGVWHHATAGWYSAEDMGARIMIYGSNDNVVVNFLVDNIVISRVS